MIVCSCHVPYAFQSESTLYGCLNVKELLAWNRHKVWTLSDCNWTRTQNHLARKRTLNHLANMVSAVFWGLTCTVRLNVCFCHVTYSFQSESTLYSCLNVKELLAQSMPKVWRFSDCNWTGTQNYLVHKWTFHHLANMAKWLSCVLSSCLYGTFQFMFLSCHVRVSEWIHTL